MVDTVKVCRVCEEELPLSQFHPNKSCSLGVIGTCRTCTNAKKATWYNDNRKARQDAANASNRKRKLEWIERLGGKCAHCNGEFPACCFDFHHVEGKDVNPSKALTWHPKRAEAELTKCILLCANCHRIVHFGGGE